MGSAEYRSKVDACLVPSPSSSCHHWSNPRKSKMCGYPCPLIRTGFSGTALLRQNRAKVVCLSGGTASAWANPFPYTPIDMPQLPPASRAAPPAPPGRRGAQRWALSLQDSSHQTLVRWSRHLRVLEPCPAAHRPVRREAQRGLVALAAAAAKQALAGNLASAKTGFFTAFVCWVCCPDSAPSSATLQNLGQW